MRFTSEWGVGEEADWLGIRKTPKDISVVWVVFFESTKAQPHFGLTSVEGKKTPNFPNHFDSRQPLLSIVNGEVAARETCEFLRKGSIVK